MRLSILISYRIYDYGSGVDSMGISRAAIVGFVLVWKTRSRIITLAVDVQQVEDLSK
jgi:hypothetical protein